MLLNIVNYFILDLDKFHFVDVPALVGICIDSLVVSIDGECSFLVEQALKMSRKKAETFLFIPSVLVVIVSFVALINITSAELNKSLSEGGRLLTFTPIQCL